MSISLYNNTILLEQIARAKLLLNPVLFHRVTNKASSNFIPSYSYVLIQCFELHREGVRPVDFDLVIPESLIFKIPKEILENGAELFNSSEGDHPMSALQMIMEASFTFPDLDLASSRLQDHINQTCALDHGKITQCDTCIYRAIAQASLRDYFNGLITTLSTDTSSAVIDRLRRITTVIDRCLGERSEKWEPSRTPTPFEPNHQVVALTAAQENMAEEHP